MCAFVWSSRAVKNTVNIIKTELRFTHLLLFEQYGSCNLSMKLEHEQPKISSAKKMREKQLKQSIHD
jgi:hypothetical protein